MELTSRRFETHSRRRVTYVGAQNIGDPFPMIDQLKTSQFRSYKEPWLHNVIVSLFFRSHFWGFATKDTLRRELFFSELTGLEKVADFILMMLRSWDI